MLSNVQGTWTDSFTGEMMRINSDDLSETCDSTGFPWVFINYGDHIGFACDWGDCLEEMIFCDGYNHPEPYILFDDKKLFMKRLFTLDSWRDND
jgi:hypothetical protein